jgi:hypothetical protein
MEPDLLVEYDQVVCDLRDSLRDTTSGLHYAPMLIRRVLETGAWRKRYDRATRSEVGFDTFAEFVAAKPTEGLGCDDIALVEDVIGRDVQAKELYDEAARNSVGTNQHRKGLDNIQRHTAPTGTSERAALRRLRKEAGNGNERAAALRDEILAGNLSAHAAMVELGFRPKTVTVPVGKPESVAATLRKYMAPDDLRTLRGLLATEAGD